MELKTIAQWLTESGYQFSYKGDDSTEISGFASLGSCEAGKITWVKKQENYEKLEDRSGITVAVVQDGLDLDIPNQIIAGNSKEVFFGILHHFWGTEKKQGFVGTGTYISPDAEIDPTAYIGYNCSIDGKVKIGANTVIENNVSISNSVVIGDNCLVHSGVVIGADGFGFAFGDDGLPIKVEHFGGVIIGNRVEVGANTCIDRGTIENTVIYDDVKIDNLVHIAHNVVLQKGAVVVAGAIICGSAQLGEDSYVAPGGIVKNQLQVGNNAFVGLGAVVTKPVDEYSVVAGVPAKEIRKVKPGDK
nr:hypothetical protein [Clostridia bacterium]